MNQIQTVIFWLSAALLVYVIAGYPLLLRMIARSSSRPVRKADFLPSVAIVIPARNAAAYLDRKIQSVLALEYPRELLDIVIAAEPSRDETEEIARGYAAWDVRLLDAPAGREAALNAAIATTRCDIVVVSDIWQIFEPASIREMMRCFADPEVGMVSGEVVMEAREASASERNLSLFAHLESWFDEKLGAIDSMLGSGGSFYAVRRKLMPRIPTGAMVEDLYVAMFAFFRGFRIVAEPEAAVYDDAVPIEASFADKIKTQEGDLEILKQYPGLLQPLDRMRFHYLSYKAARFLLPFALILLVLTTFHLRSRWALIAAVVPQALLYSLAILDRWIGDSSFLKRFSAAARTFVEIAFASLHALPTLFAPAPK